MADRVFARRLGRVVRQRRTTLGMTQERLALLSGTSVRFLISLELGESPGVRLDKLMQVLDALGLSLLVEEGEQGAGGAKEPRDFLHEKRAAEEACRYARAFEHVAKSLERPAE